MGPTTIANASGQNIAVDGSTISATNTDSLSLDGSAEAGATAVNLVNAVGSMVTNGVNIAYTANMNSTPSLTQTNSIVQTH
jgi:hypothetical protein